MTDYGKKISTKLEVIKMNESILKEWQEAIGILSAVKDEGYAITLEFTTVWCVQVPRMSNDLIKKFEEKIGKYIGVLRTDIPEKEILLREIEGNE